MTALCLCTGVSGLLWRIVILREKECVCVCIWHVTEYDCQWMGLWCCKTFVQVPLIGMWTQATAGRGSANEESGQGGERVQEHFAGDGVTEGWRWQGFEMRWQGFRMINLSGRPSAGKRGRTVRGGYDTVSFSFNMNFFFWAHWVVAA